MRHHPRLVDGHSPIASLLLVTACAAAPALADEFAAPATQPADCLARAALMINPGETMAMQLFDGTRVEGRLVSFDLEGRRVQLERWDELGAASFGVAADDVQRYEYEERSGREGGVTGAVVGTVLGALVGISHTKGDEEMLAGLKGATTGGLIGAGVGYAVGASLGDEYRPAGTITCGEP